MINGNRQSSPLANATKVFRGSWPVTNQIPLLDPLLDPFFDAVQRHSSSRIIAELHEGVLDQALPLLVRFEGENPARHLPIAANLGARKMSVIGEPPRFMPGGPGRGSQRSRSLQMSVAAFMFQMGLSSLCEQRQTIGFWPLIAKHLETNCA
jgi:hypothetical protein